MSAIRREIHETAAKHSNLTEGTRLGIKLIIKVPNIMPFDDVIVYGTFKGRDLPAVITAGKQIDPDKDYKLAVSDFTAANQETNENLRTKGLQFPGEAGLLRDAFADLIRKRKVIE